MASSTMLFLCLTTVFAVCFAEELRAVVLLTGAANGFVSFTQEEDGGPVKVQGNVTGLTQGLHGFHVHEKGDLSGGCGSTGGHFNPDHVNHGAPGDAVRHVGDLGNIKAEANGIAVINIQDNIISLSGRNCIVGRGVVVHSGEDDLGKGGQSDSLTTGHAGSRVACGVIGIQSPVEPWDHSGAGRISWSPLLCMLLLPLVHVRVL